MKFEKVWKQYVDLIRKDHHKNRDRFFEINQVFNGEIVSWQLIHEGYINEYSSHGYGSYEDAEKEAIKVVKKWIKEYEAESKN